MKMWFIIKQTGIMPQSYQSPITKSQNSTGKLFLISLKFEQPNVETEDSISIIRFNSHFSLKLHNVFWKHFYSMVLCSVGSDYYAK